MKLVDDAKSAWKWYSMHAMGWPAAAIASWCAMPQEWRDFVTAHVPSTGLLAGIAVILAGGMAGRLLDQGGSRAPDA